MTSDPGQDWQRLGELLIRRRLDLDPRYRNRQVFAAERGVEYRIVSDFERHRRSNYHAVTIAEIERAYDLPPGSVGRVLAGGDLLPEQPHARTPLLPVVAKSAREAGVDPFDPLDPWTRPIREQVRAARNIHGDKPTGSQIFHGTPASSYEAGVWDDLSLDEESRIIGIAIIRAYRARDEAARQGNGRSGRAGLALVVTSGGP